jgi:hypothetical protein
LAYPLHPPVALIFSLQDFGTFLWTLFTWRAERWTLAQSGPQSAQSRI